MYKCKGKLRQYTPGPKYIGTQILEIFLATVFKKKTKKKQKKK